MSTAPPGRMEWLDAKTTLMPQPVLSRLVTASKPRQIHPRLLARDPHADDFVREEPPIVIPRRRPEPAITRGCAERLAVVALAASVALVVAAVLGFPF